MAEKCYNNSNTIKDKVCIHTNKVYDACREKDCLEDLRVYLTRAGQELIDRAINVKIRKAEIIWVYSDVEPVSFNKGYYTVDIKYFFRITLDVFTGVGRPTTIEGLATFDKRIILFGSEGNAKIYTSMYKPNDHDLLESVKTNVPRSVIEVVDPIALNAKLVEKNCCGCDIDITAIPTEICRCFDDDLVISDSNKSVFVTLGIFTIVKLERSVQLLIPIYDFCVPDKECVGSTDENPCNIFRNLCFPVDEFFPPVEQNSNCNTNR